MTNKIPQLKLFTKIASLTMRDKILLTAAIILFIVVLLAFSRATGTNNTTEQEVQALQNVTLSPVSELSQVNKNLSVTGRLRSKSEADLRVDIPGRVTGVYAKVGEWLTSGTLIAEVENGAQRAQVTQALGVLQAAKAKTKSAEAQLQKVSNGATLEDKNIITSQVAAAESSLSSAYNSALNVLQDAYASMNSIILFTADELILNPDSPNPKLKFQTTEYSAKISSENRRVVIGEILSRNKPQSLSPVEEMDKIDVELINTIDDLAQVKQFTDSLLTSLDGAITTNSISSTTISSYITATSSARSQLLSMSSALANSQSSISSAKNALLTIQENKNKILTGARTEDIDTAVANLNAANASVTSALGSYQSAVVLLEKTRVRAPISGYLSTFSAKRGDYISSQELGRIVGDGGSEVIFYIPSTDSNRVKIGDAISVSGTATGTVTTVSNSTDVFTQQLEVRADLSSGLDMPNGSVVTINILKNTDKDIIADTTTKVLVPINAIKFDVNDSKMFTVKDATATTTTLVSTAVTLGDVVGSMVYVTGIEKEVLVVTDARGLRDGQEVTIVR